MNQARLGWVLVAILWVVALLNYLDRQIIYSVFPLLERDLHLSGVELGLLSTAFLWVYALASPIAGFVAERFGRRRVITISLLIWSAVTWATSLSRNLTELLFARALMGLSEACYLPAGLALIAEHHSDRTRSLATGIHTSGVYAGMVLGGVLGGWAGQHYGWRFAFIVLGVTGIAYLAVLMPGLRRFSDRTTPKTTTPGFVSSVRELLHTGGFLRLTVVFGGTSIANWMVYTWLPLFIYERFGVSLAEAGVTATLYLQAGSITGILVGGWLADRWSARSARGRLFTQAMGLVTAAPFLALAGWTSSREVLIAALIVFGIGKGMYDCNTMPVLCQIARSDLRATGYGIFNMAGCLAGGMIAPVAGALRSSIGLGACIQICAVVVLLSAALLLMLRSPAIPSLDATVQWNRKHA